MPRRNTFSSSGSAASRSARPGLAPGPAGWRCSARPGCSSACSARGLAAPLRAMPMLTVGGLAAPKRSHAADRANVDDAAAPNRRHAPAGQLAGPEARHAQAVQHILHLLDRRVFGLRDRTGPWSDSPTRGIRLNSRSRCSNSASSWARSVVSHTAGSRSRPSAAISAAVGRPVGVDIGRGGCAALGEANGHGVAIPPAARPITSATRPVRSKSG